LIPLEVSRVKEIIAMNRDGKEPEDLGSMMKKPVVKELGYGNVDGQDRLDRFDGKSRSKRKPKRKNNQNRNQRRKKR